jgi:hypothetical protein
MARMTVFATTYVGGGDVFSHQPTHEKGLHMQAFSRAADGIRTHDLLHGKQTL